MDLDLDTDKAIRSQSSIHTSLSPLDSERFGIVVARNPLLLRDGLAEANAFCVTHGVDMLIARCPTTDMASLHALEGDGFRVMDTLVYWKLSLATDYVAGRQYPVAVRFLTPADAPTVGSIATQAFASYTGHYHADPLLDHDTCTRVYAAWATRCCSEMEVADGVAGAVWENEVIGFLALKHQRKQQLSDVALTAVAPHAQGRGALGAMIAFVGDHLRHAGFKYLEYSCVITNIPAQRALVRHGFAVTRSYHTLHKWYARRG